MGRCPVCNKQMDLLMTSFDKTVLDMHLICTECKHTWELNKLEKRFIESAIKMERTKWE